MKDKSLGENIKKYRKLANLSQEQLSEKLGISRNFLSAIERGVKIPSLENLIKIANCLNTGVDKLISEKLSIGYKIESEEIYAKLELLKPKDRNTAIKVFGCVVDKLSEEND